MRTLQAPHRAISAQRGIPPEGVYIAYFQFGSPAARYGLVPGRRIVEVDGQPTPDLDVFLRQVSGRPDRSSLRIKTLGWNGAPEVITLKLDRHYWPAYELQRSRQRLGTTFARIASHGAGTIGAMVRVVRATPIELATAVQALRDGELVAFPTETVYGLGAHAGYPAALRRMFELKGRPTTHPLIVHIDSIRYLSRWAREVPEAAQKLAERFWPGPLTLVLPRAENVHRLVTGGQDTVAVRVPAHRWRSNC